MSAAGGGETRVTKAGTYNQSPDWSQGANRGHRQNRALLVKIAESTRGEYLTIEDAATRLPELFKTSAAVSMPIDERLQTLWDRAWLMYLVVGLLCVEWLIRKILKLA